MDEWNQKQHGSSGLDRARAGEQHHASPRPKRARIAFLTPARRAGCLADVRQQHLPGPAVSRTGRCRTLEHFFHYRNLDVSTLKELARRWAPGVVDGLVKEGAHLARADIHESIRELRHYRAQLFAPAFAGDASASGRRRSEEQPGLDHGVGIERDAVDALIEQPAGEIRVIRRALAADADVFARACGRPRSPSPAAPSPPGRARRRASRRSRNRDPGRA